MILVLTLALGLASLYLVWRVRFGRPLPGMPYVLCFHKISRRFLWEGTWTTPARFFAYIDRLTRRGYRFIDENQYLEAIRAPDAANERLVLLTFDDGYQESLRLVLPGLERRGIPVHVFLPTDYAGSDNRWDLSLGRAPSRHLSWEEAKAMAERGVTFGSHGAGHRDLSRLDDAEVRDELERSRDVLEDRLGRPARTVSYPFGRANPSACSAAAEAGYEAAFSLYPPHANGVFDRFAIGRAAVYIIDPVWSVEMKFGRGAWSWFEEMKCRAINAVAVLTPILKPSRGRDTIRRTGRDSKAATNSPEGERRTDKTATRRTPQR
jgi:peptidoglycan/xylan/chitin deacetylase (PgdA/CDA1 family)